MTLFSCLRGLSRALLLPGVLSTLGACTTFDDADHGQRTRELLASQHIDPVAAERNAGRAVPTDGRNSRDAMLRQAESFKSPPPNAVGPVIGSGGR